MENKLLILPFDHRSSFSRDILGVSGRLSVEQSERISDLKQVIFQGFFDYWQEQLNKERLGILVDEQFGANIIRQAKEHGIVLCVPVEKSGQTEFHFENKFSWRRKIKKVQPDYVKALVRFNPKGDSAMNGRQLARLNKLGVFCQKKEYKLIIELLVPPTGEDLQIAGSKAKYDNQLRHKRTVAAIREMKKVVKPDVWKLEGLAKKNWPSVIKAINKGSKIIVLGRGEDQRLVENWLKAASSFPDIIGFAIGRTIFLKILQDYVAGKINRPQAIESISDRFAFFIEYWESCRE